MRWHRRLRRHHARSDEKPAALVGSAAVCLRPEGTARADGCQRGRLLCTVSNCSGVGWPELRSYRGSRVGARLRASIQRLAPRRVGKRERSFHSAVRSDALPIEAAVKEIRRAVKNGHRGVIYPSVPMELRDVPHINDSIYDPLWAACQELTVPICFHAGASSAIQIPAYEGYSPTIAAAFQAITRPASTVSVLVNLLISKILMRFPDLKVVFAESGLGWGAYLLEYTDFQATGDQLPRNGYDLMPSQMFKRQCYLVGWYDQASLRVRNYIGTENILWSTQFPLATSTWPNTQEAMFRSFDGVDAKDRQKILWENAAKLYKIPAM